MPLHGWVLSIQSTITWTHLYAIPVTTTFVWHFVQCWTNVEDVGPTLYKIYTNVVCLLRYRLKMNLMVSQQTLDVDIILFQCWASVADIHTRLFQCLVFAGINLIWCYIMHVFVVNTYDLLPVELPKKGMRYVCRLIWYPRRDRPRSWRYD